MTPSVRVVVAEDERLARERITSLVRAAPELTLVGEASHGLEALDLIVSLEPDLVFLDIEMPELNGLGVVAALDDAALPGIVFITAYEEYALRAFEVDAIDYLQKPVTPERFSETVRRALKRLVQPATLRASAVQAVKAVAALGRAPSGRRARFVIRRGSTHTFMPASDVVWIGAADNYLELHVAGRLHLVRGTIKDAAKELDPAAFLRIHRSAIVNIAHVVAVQAQPAGGYVVRMSDGVRLKTSRQYAVGVRALVKPRRS